MNLPLFTRSALVTGAFSMLTVLSGYAATPPPMEVESTPFNVGSVAFGAAAHLNNHLYYAGGNGPGGTVTNAVLDLDLNKKTVTSLPSMPTARAGLGLTGFLFSIPGGAQNVLIAIGGTNGSTASGATEMFSFSTGSWSVMAPMPTPRAYLSVVAGTDGNVYALGGVDAGGHTVNTVEVFNPAKNSWSTGPSLTTPRSHLAGTMVYLDAILVAGGQDANGNILNTTEAYSLLNGGSFQNYFPMNVAREDFGLSLAESGILYAFGGRSSAGKAEDSIEGFSFAAGAWTMAPHKLLSPSEGVAAVEGLTGTDYVIGGQNDAGKFLPAVTKVFPFRLGGAHNVTLFVHGLDEPTLNGDFAMDQQTPLNAVGLLNLSILGTTNFAAFPAVHGTIESGGSLTVTVPGTIIVGVINSLTITATDLDGSHPVVVGSASSLLGLSGIVNIPITTPLKITNKVLVLSIFSLLGVDLDLGGGVVVVTLNGLDGKPNNPF